MTLEISADQSFMRDEARRLLTERAGSEQLRRAIDAGGFDRELWTTIGELGWCGVAIPEAHGGLGLGSTELVLLAEQCGRRLAPVPFWSTACLAAPLIAGFLDSSDKAEVLGRIASGAAATVALADLSAPDPLSSTNIAATESSGGFLLTGTASAVPDLPSSEIVIVPARLDGELALFALDVAATCGIDITPVPTINLLRPFGRLTLDGAPATRIDAAGPAAALLPAKLGLAAEQIGAAQGCFDLTLDYITGREQFGRTIASFQAIKHRCAALLVDIAEARSLLYGAAASLDAGAHDAALEIDALGALASQLLFRVAEEAIQLHGGVGNTWEYDPHFYLRRAQSSTAFFGTPSSKLDRIADRLLGKPAA